MSWEGFVWRGAWLGETLHRGRSFTATAVMILIAMFIVHRSEP